MACKNRAIKISVKCRGECEIIPVLNYAVLHEDVWVLGGIAPHILNHDSRRR